MEIESLRSKEIEQNILGNIINNNSILLELRNRGITSKDFYFDNHKVIYDAVNSVFDKYTSYDLITVLQYLNDTKGIERTSISYVTELSSEAILISKLDSYLDILKSYSKKRSLLDISKYINSNIDKDPEEMQQEINKMLLNSLSTTVTETVKGQADEYIAVLEKRISGEDVALKTGLFTLDNCIDGFSNSDLITIFAFSGVGKTTLACQIATNVIRQHKRVLFFSLEMPKEQIRDRLLSNLTSIEYKKIKNGQLEGNELNKLISYNDRLSEMKSILILEDTHLTDITSKIQLEAIKNDIDIVFIDYVNLIRTSKDYRNEYEQIRECTKALKQLAKNINKPIVILAQAKQEVADKNVNGNIGVYQKLNDNDIAGGASIFRDSDKVIGMYRNVDLDQEAGRGALDEKGLLDYNSKSAEYNPACVNLLVRKCRSGKKETLAFKWEPKYYRISNRG